jgi:hypothetical protein
LSSALVEFWRLPEGLLTLDVPEQASGHAGFFNFGPEDLCYGESTHSTPAQFHGDSFPDLARHVVVQDDVLRLPFDPATVIDNLRLERYPLNSRSAMGAVLSNEGARRVYYSARPLLTDSLRKSLQRLFFRGWQHLPFPSWPVDTTVERLLEKLLFLAMKAKGITSVPFIWFWPEGAAASAIVTHDVETAAGVSFIQKLLDIDESFGIKTSFQIVPAKRYEVSKELLHIIRARSCEVNVHGLNHDGNLFRSRQTFLKQAELINRYVRDFEADGFRSACMYRNAAWFEDLDISYDMSVPNVAHLEPQRGGCCTVFPYYIGKVLELPLTAVQDYSLFHILGDYSIELWKKQIELIYKRHGLISFIIHPDYVLEQKAMAVYEKLLNHLSQLRSGKNLWIARPGEVNRWWRERSQMRLVFDGNVWTIVGKGRELARVAFASIQGEKLVYTVDHSSEVLVERRAVC